ncbi:Nuclear export mediator factor NEMF [Trichostrongylus colubriformis]|uniref:Nuclear export mediator factor NEMF n=1 Tax=Trichostrongylus colubriformis TaxID=6319 RepID=A0AAN8FM67_TRICO
MKSRFTALDVSAAVRDLKSLEGMRIQNVYDINHKTYIMKLSQGTEKAIILFESGIRIHRAYHDYQKAPFPSSFSQKLRKHLNNHRLTKISQLGADRVVDLQIDDDDRAVHVIVELYDRGNIVLTDSSYTILNILRPRTDKDNDVRLVVREQYPRVSREFSTSATVEEITTMLSECDQSLALKRAVARPGLHSTALIEHVLLVEGMNPDLQVSEQPNDCAARVCIAMKNAADITREIASTKTHGYIPYIRDRRSDGTDIVIFQEYHPYLFAQHEKGHYVMHESFSEAVDAFYAAQDAQRQQQLALKTEKEAMKKLDNVKKDQYRRITELEQSREEKMIMADLIIINQTLVDSAIKAICNALAQKSTWSEVEEMHKHAVSIGDPVASAIVKMDLANNKIIMRLSEDTQGANSRDVPVDLGMTAFNNSTLLYQGVKAAAEKIIRTEAAADKAVKNAEGKASDTIKQVHVRADAARVRKEMWFEKFIWFISSENYVVIVGRDAQQNELLVKKYLRPGDIYVHADAHGAASVVIRNKAGGGTVPPRTMTEAAQMAICCSSSWSSHVVSSAWWVYDHQVSKVAPSGEYLSHGSFMIRGKKNFMPASPLVLGFGILFRLDESSVISRKEKLVNSHESPKKTDRNAESGDEEVVVSEEEQEADVDKPDEEYPDIKLDVPTVNLRSEPDTPGDYSVINFNTKDRPKKQLQVKEKETQEYLEKKEMEERKAAAAKKFGKRQKHKMEKVRRKYRDQDEDEREMRLTLLGSRGKQGKAENPTSTGKKQNDSKSKSGGDAKRVTRDGTDAPAENGRSQMQQSDNQLDNELNQIAELQINDKQNANETPIVDSHDDHNKGAPVTGEDDEEKDEVLVTEDSEGLIAQLTSRPIEEDMLLYAVPMVGPYQALSNFKYKVKITPGTARKGKAGKAALELFLRIKSGDPREQALIRALVGDENACRNIPKGCRVSAPQLYAK